MATDAQIKANRVNSTLSTGPTSELGKKTAAANSAKRGGISGKGKALAPELWNQVVAAKFVLTQGNSPADEYDQLLIEDAALARVLWLECEEQLIALREHQADLAKINWQDLRELEAGELAPQLARHPHATVRKLRQTPQGCAYLIDLWRVVEVDLLQHGTLTDATRDQILNLLGVTAAVRLAGLTELDAPAGDDATTSLVARAQAIVTRELARLRTLVDSPELKAACEQTRQRTIEGTEPPLSKDARLLNRYRNQHARKYQWCLNELKRRRHERERRNRSIAALQRQVQRQELAAIRRAHADKTLPPEIKAKLPEVPPAPPRPTTPVPGAFRTGWDRESLEAKLKQPMSKRNRQHYEQMLAKLIQQERLASAPGPR
jgi:hypothetical protein